MIKAIAFDLDDTLIDTTHLLVPLASHSAFKAMVARGLKIDFETFERDRRNGALSMKHIEIFKMIAEKHCPNPNPEMADAASEAFYNPPIPNELPLLDGALKNLEYLKDRYTLFLVTSGSIPTQKRKVKATGTTPFFKNLYMMDGFAKERKRLAFEDILQSLSLKPEELLSIGNRLSQEIHDAKELGCQTCYFKYGEHVGEVARNSFEIPDFTAEHHRELLEACRL